ncbi:hypothetical protein PbDSM24746_58760 [Paenibacillus macerans]|nr:hypothetical protein PbDSM24746_58760 [Paenibacillus macerans]GBK72202.1 hypothetical protein PbJCM17693_59100 [Paenibacillus macerans]
MYRFGKYRLMFTQEVMGIMHSYRQISKGLPESGGILLGRIYTDNRIIIDQISVPGKGDKSGRFFFERDVKRAQEIASGAWEKSDGEVRYLGEWHTHPEAIPKPSPTDRKLIIGMIQDSILDQEFLFLVIVGIQENYVGVSYKGKRYVNQLAFCSD